MTEPAIKEIISCPNCGEKNEILTLPSYVSGKFQTGTVSGGGTKYYIDKIPVRVISTGLCKSCNKSIRKAIKDEFPDSRLLK